MNVVIVTIPPGINTVNGEKMTDTELQLIGKDKKHAFFNVYVHGKIDCVVKIERVKPTKCPPGFISRFLTREETKLRSNKE